MNIRLLFLATYFLIVIQNYAQSFFKSQSSGFKVDCFPDIWGGNNEMKRFLHDNLIYPPEDFKAGKAGKVALSFIITKTGKAINITVVKHVSNAIDKEAIRLLKLIEWVPAYKGGEAVNISYGLEIKFSISKYKKQIKERGFDSSLFTDLPADTSLAIYETTERFPVFNDSAKTFTEFIYANMEYPKAAIRHNIEGAIKLTFVVEPNGKTSDIKIINGGLGGNCNNEAVRIIALTKWLPAVKDKKYVRYRMSFTINFSLRRNNKIKGNFGEHSLEE